MDFSSLLAIKIYAKFFSISGLSMVWFMLKSLFSLVYLHLLQIRVQIPFLFPEVETLQRVACLQYLKFASSALKGGRVLISSLEGNMFQNGSPLRTTVMLTAKCNLPRSRWPYAPAFYATRHRITIWGQLLKPFGASPLAVWRGILVLKISPPCHLEGSGRKTTSSRRGNRIPRRQTFLTQPRERVQNFM